MSHFWDIRDLAQQGLDYIGDDDDDTVRRQVWAAQRALEESVANNRAVLVAEYGDDPYVEVKPCGCATGSGSGSRSGG